MNKKVLPGAIDFASLGGEKKDYTSTVNPVYDRTADEVNAAFYNVAMMSQTVVLARASFSIPSSLNVNDILNPDFVATVWGSDYSTRPTLEFSAIGQFYLTFPQKVLTGFGDLVDVNIRFPSVSCSNANSYYACSVSPLSHYRCLVSCFDNTGFLATPVNESLIFSCA